MPRIVVTDATFPRLDQEKAVAARYGTDLIEARCSSPEDVVKAATGTNVLLVQFAQVTADAIERLAPNAAIVRYGLGLDNIDLKAAQRKGVRVAYVPDYATGEVADHTAALILTALRKILPLDRSVRAGSWDPVGIAKPIQSFATSTAGFIGFGRIGREVHARLKPFLRSRGSVCGRRNVEFPGRKSSRLGYFVQYGRCDHFARAADGRDSSRGKRKAIVIDEANRRDRQYRPRCIDRSRGA